MPERDPKTGRFPARPEAPASGEGWGGPAKGAGTNRFDGGPENQISAAYARGKRQALRELLAGDMPDVAKTWREIRDDPNAPAMARIVAAEKIAEKVEGKVPTTQVNVDGGALGDWTDDELRAAADELRSRLAGQDRSGTGEAEGREPVN